MILAFGDSQELNTNEKVLFNIPLGVNKNHQLFPYKENEESKMNAFRNLGENPSFKKRKKKMHLFRELLQKKPQG